MLTILKLMVDTMVQAGYGKLGCHPKLAKSSIETHYTFVPEELMLQFRIQKLSNGSSHCILGIKEYTIFFKLETE